MYWGFERGRLYNRRAEIHGRFGGQQQGGIITPSTYPVVIIITGDDGLAHGYRDTWKGDGTFHYFGEGQIGDMEMRRGNAAVYRHVENGKDILLFKKERDGLRFIDQMVFEKHHIVKAPDREGNLRDAIVFELRTLGSILEATAEPAPLGSQTVDDLRSMAFAAINPSPGRREATTTVIERSRAVQSYVVARAQGRCEGCGKDAPFLRRNGVPYLEPHHIRRLSDGGPDDPRYVIALCPNCHRRVHHGDDGDHYNTLLFDRMKDIEPSRS